jgi:hypothetical protein
MTSRATRSAGGRQRDYAHNNIEVRDIPLRFVPSASPRQASPQELDEELDEELDPESTSALLRQHLRDSAESDDDAAQITRDSNTAH